MKFSSRVTRTIWIVLTIVVALIALRAYFRLTDDFRIANISHEIPYHPEWEIPHLNSADQAEIDTILNQKFTYLGKGAQSYVFASEDQQYVIKFFKFKHLKPSWLAMMLPNVVPFSPYLERVSTRKQKKFNSIFAGYRLAYDLNRDESGLIYMQLNPTQQSRTVTVIDKIGLERNIDVGAVPFIIQYKGETFRTILAQLLDNGDLETAKQRIGQMLDLYQNEYRKGIYDRDHGVLHNTGFIGDKPLHLDVGKLSQDDRIKQQANYEQDLAKVVARMLPWLETNYPQSIHALTQYIEHKLTQDLGHRFAVAQ
ncbi:MAG: hypothetical protein H0X51_00965 [Parachlamydiaceae bacterium]|nr:hypothetical protein [Parachlamydiaceae bacterium]